MSKVSYLHITDSSKYNGDKYNGKRCIVTHYNEQHPAPEGKIWVYVPECSVYFWVFPYEVLETETKEEKKEMTKTNTIAFTPEALEAVSELARSIGYALNDFDDAVEGVFETAAFIFTSPDGESNVMININALESDPEDPDAETEYAVSFTDLEKIDE